ncbi:hypothetical protein [Kordia zhangzhouensis]|uniref:hypothetical protein n=1 Tax=Kordia zhangzhouensis TaxID=1620405 RepID=UPI000629360C|nr:hypothetical protein [Kordia zhangzhouensis]
MKRTKSMLQLKKSVISNLKGSNLQGGRVTTDQDTMKYCDDSSTQNTNPATLSYSNCGQCGGW